MPVTVQDVLDRVNAFDLDFEVEEAFNDTARDFTDLQREQLFSGINAEGDPIEPEYSPRTVAIKKKKGQPTDRVTLRDTGDFYKGVFMDPREDIYVVDSATADVHVRFTERFANGIRGKTVWSRDSAWWLVSSNITLGPAHPGGGTVSPPQMRAIALHEVGHLLGLDHSAAPDHIMSARIRVRDLTEPDRLPEHT